ncbi:MAG: PIN domain-containing protein [Terriglobales bacterium]|jgi:predicted nucleic acid-binding protein
MSRVFWDTNLFIYLFEDYGALSEGTGQLRSKMLDRGDQLLTSTLTLGEILVKPTERNDSELCRRYEHAISSAATLIAFDVKAARVYAALRLDRSLRAPDAIQLACAASANVDLFVTNDERLQGKQVDGIQFIVPLGRVPL